MPSIGGMIALISLILVTAYAAYCLFNWMRVRRLVRSQKPRIQPQKKPGDVSL